MDFPFERDRFRHTLLARGGQVCLVERRNLLTDSVHWEVAVVRHVSERVGPLGVLLPAGERYPSANDWGRYGWTFTRLAEARQRFEQECRSLRAPAPNEPL